jgi:hypothetical protein
MNKNVVRHRVDYVYGIDDSLMAFVSRYWGFPKHLTFPP